MYEKCSNPESEEGEVEHEMTFNFPKVMEREMEQYMRDVKIFRLQGAFAWRRLTLTIARQRQN